MVRPNSQRFYYTNLNFCICTNNVSSISLYCVCRNADFVFYFTHVNSHRGTFLYNRHFMYVHVDFSFYFHLLHVCALSV